MTLKQFLNSIGFTNLDSELTTDNSSNTETKPETDEKHDDKKDKKELDTTPEKSEGSTNEQDKLAALQKEIDELKAANAKLLSQTPVEKPMTAQDALLDLMGIEREENGEQK